MGLEANDMSDSDNRELFVKQLSSLKDGEYISHDHYRITIDAFEKFKLDQEAIKENVLAASAVSINVAEVKAEIPKQAEENERRITKKRLSPEEIRERNISWLLNIGVLMLLIGGIYIATSNWSTMSNVMKSGCIALISVLFYGIAIFADKVLKIKKNILCFLCFGQLIFTNTYPFHCLVRITGHIFFILWTRTVFIRSIRKHLPSAGLFPISKEVKFKIICLVCFYHNDIFSRLYIGVCQIYE